MSYSEIDVQNIKFNPFTDHNPGKSRATRDSISFITPWMKITSYPRTYVAMRDSSGNNIERVNVYTEVEEKEFQVFLEDLQERARAELRSQNVDPNPENHWNDLLAHKKFLRVKLHVRPSKVLQLYAYREGDLEHFDIDLEKVSNYFYTGVKVRYLIEIRPVLHKNGRSGITLKVVEVEFQKRTQSKLTT